MQRPTSRTLASLLRCTGSKGTLTRSANSRPFSGGFLGPRSLAFQRESLALEKLLSNRRTLGASVTRSRPIHIGTGSDRARRSSTSAVWGRVGWSAAGAAGALLLTVAFSPGRIGDGPNGHATTSENQVSDTRNLPDRSSPSLELSADTNEPSIVIDEDILRETLHAVENDLMSPVEGHEAFFNDLMTKAQALAVQGPESYIAAAIMFIRALALHPAKLDMLRELERSIDPPVYKILVQILEMYLSLIFDNVIPIPDLGQPSEPSSGQDWEVVTESETEA